MDRDKWESSCKESMNKLQLSEIENIRLRDDNGRLIEFCNNLKVENQRREEVDMGEKWWHQNMVDKDENTTIKCTKCDYRGPNSDDMNKHMENHMEETYEKCEHCELEFEFEEEKMLHNTEKHQIPSAPPLPDDSDYTCEDCDYQTMQFQHLLEHIEIKHKKATVPPENKDLELFKCKDCPNKFPSYGTLMKHRKQKHPKSCREFTKGNCTRGISCYYIHTQAMDVSSSPGNTSSERNQTQSDTFKCHTCSEVFTSKNSMMRHKKANHGQTIKCKQFPNCRRAAVDCWYLHEHLEQESPPVIILSSPNTGAPSPSANAEQGFRTPNPPQHPPDQIKEILTLLGGLQKQMEKTNQEIMTLKMNQNQ